VAARRPLGGRSGRAPLRLTWRADECCFHAVATPVASVLAYDRPVADSYRRHALIEAPIEDVWPVVSDPRTHPDWWPEVTEVRASGELAEGEEYLRVSRRLGFLDQVDGVWVVERLEHLKEAHFRCTVSGAYTRFALPGAAPNICGDRGGDAAPEPSLATRQDIEQALLRAMASGGARRPPSGGARQHQVGFQGVAFSARPVTGRVVEGDRRFARRAGVLTEVRQVDAMDEGHASRGPRSSLSQIAQRSGAP
jgi:hypothetical protein